MELDLTLKKRKLSLDYQKQISDFKCIASSEYDGLVKDYVDDTQVADFLKDEAFTYEEMNLAKTTLFVTKQNDIVGYYTSFVSSFQKTHSKKLMQSTSLETLIKESKIKEYPSINLLYFGVEEAYQRKGVGELILIDFLERARILSGLTGIALIVVESFPESTGFYEKYGFIKIKTENKRDVLVFPTIDLN